ncbi:MAG: FAD-dependent oxidoreductase [Actinomycetota bacterium]|nr:FAD-dependent oxidoreductase [Actinomycetota bacterium]
MANPTILAVDDDPQVLRAVERDLRRRYARDYRILAAPSGQEALDLAEQLRLRDDEVALFLVDQRMPGMTGVEFLERAIEVFPDSKRTLLTAYADTEAAIKAINEVGLHHYIMKPWDPPEERLYPVLDDLLENWLESWRPPFEGLRIVADRWSKPAHELKAFLARNQVPYRFVDAAEDEGRELIALAEADTANLPLVLFAQGPPLTNPSPAEVADRVGLHVHAELPFYDLVIVGAGPSGLAAAVYGASEGLKTLLVEQEAPGGQAGQSARIENYLGFPAGLSGAELARRAVAQAQRFGAELLVPQQVVGANRKDPYRILQLSDGSHVNCHAVLITTGVQYRTLPAEGAAEVTGAGLYYGASRIEAVTHREQDVFVVGGGNSAGQAAMFLSQFARTVTILVRGDSLVETMSRYLIDQLESTDNIRIRYGVGVVEVGSEEERLSSLTLEHLESGKRETVDAGALFVFIGQAPRTEWIAHLVACDEHGFILSGPGFDPPPKGWSVERDPLPLETTVPGVFVAGDVRAGSVKRVASATGEGAMAVSFVHQHLAGL